MLCATKISMVFSDRSNSFLVFQRLDDLMKKLFLGGMALNCDFEVICTLVTFERLDFFLLPRLSAREATEG